MPADLRLRSAVAILSAGVLAAVLWTPVHAQVAQPLAGSDQLRVFVECEGGWRSACDRTHFRNEITFVNWVREPQDAQVHIIVTSQDTGAGDRYTLDFDGREELDELTDQYVVTTSDTDVQDEQVEALTRTLRLGLVRYAALAGFESAVDVQAVETDGEEGEATTQEVVDDPWDFWVFNIDADIDLESEDIQDSREYGFGFNANRTTEAWKINFRANGDFERQTFELSDTTIENNQDEWSISGFAVKTLGSHWGIGAEIEADNSTQLNRDLLLAGGAGLEWNYFPYSESTRRILLARYVVSVESVEYQDTTVFGFLDETTLKHEVDLDYEAREPWGNANIGASASQFLHRPEFPDDIEEQGATSFYSVSVRGFVRYRLFRGFSVNISGRYEVVEDQIYLPKSELSDEDILLGRRQLPTDTETSLRVGLSYSFGSIFNNAINPRFRRGVR
jgi:hypothetical protein